MARRRLPLRGLPVNHAGSTKEDDLKRTMLSLMLVAALAFGTLATPAVADHDLTSWGSAAGHFARGSSSTGCADDGSSQVSGSGDANAPNSWSHLSTKDVALTHNEADRLEPTSGLFTFCAELGNLPTPVTNSGCVLRNGKGSIALEDGRTLWLRNVHSYDVSAGALPGSVLAIKGDVVEAADAATAATMTPHHSFYAELRWEAACYGHHASTSVFYYRILEKSAVEELLVP